MMRSSREKKSSFTSSSSEDVGRTALLATIASSPIVLSAQDAFAKGGEFGLLEGRTAALVHPFFLGIMYATSLYAGYLGLQWRKVRTVGEEIQELKKASPVGADAETANPNQSKIDELTKERKELVAGNYKEKHFNAGSLLLAFGTCLAIEGRDEHVHSRREVIPWATLVRWHGNCGVVGRRRWFSAGDAERERQGEKRRTSLLNWPTPLFTAADPDGFGNRREGVSVYQLAVKKISIRVMQ